jgi:phosphoglycerate dehydrogenase-like enzyme
MDRPTVLEWVRSREPIWNLPRTNVDALAARFPEVRFVSPADRDEAVRVLAHADVVLGWAARAEDFAVAKRLRWVHLTAAGVGPQLFPEFVASDVVLTNSRGLHAVSMAEHALGVILMFSRKLHLARDAQREARWTQVEQFVAPPPFDMLPGRTLGLVGLGAIGGAIAERARAFGMSVLAVRRRPGAGHPGVDAEWGRERLNELLERSDYLVLCAPETSETSGMIGAAELARMKPSAVLVNVGRGALVDEPALIEALSAGRIAGAALDVMAEEPLPAMSPLWGMPNVIVTSHVSGMGPRYWERAMDMFAANLERWLEGRPLENVVDKRAGY